MTYRTLQALFGQIFDYSDRRQLPDQARKLGDFNSNRPKEIISPKLQAVGEYCCFETFGEMLFYLVSIFIETIQDTSSLPKELLLTICPEQRILVSNP